MNAETATTHARDIELRSRAEHVIPSGMYGHNSTTNMYLPANFPQFLAGGEGPYIRDVDGRQFVDLMCSYGPMVLGHRHPAVEEAVRRQSSQGDCLDAPSATMVELAELLVATIEHADWAILAKNGTDATTACLTIARAATGKGTILVANGSYHGAAPWSTPWAAGVLPSDRASMRYFDYNDLASFETAVAEAGDDLAGVLITPVKQIEGFDQALVDPMFAKRLRAVCDQRGALLILDDVRCGFRVNFGGSWEPIGVNPDLSAWSKAMANGYAISAIVGSNAYRDAASSVWLTGSFWFSGIAMAASIATLSVLREEEAVPRMKRAGELLRAGIEDQARAHRLALNYSGHPAMPYITFEADRDYERMTIFVSAALDAGTYLCPRHNWFLSLAHADEVIQKVLDSTDRAFDAVLRRFGND
jgi:glutamate-1-semialdehyde 2,1-aminomutase